MKEQKAKIIKVLSNNTPKHEAFWMREVIYYPEMLQVGKSANLLLVNINKPIDTPPVLDLNEDENNLIITTTDNVYYLKKYINKEVE